MLWVASKGGVLHRMVPSADSGGIDNEAGITFIRMPLIPDAEENVSIIDLFEDSQNKLWLGTNSGLAKLAQEEQSGDASFITYRYDEHNPLSLSDNVVTSIAEDTLGDLWLGTSAGLNQFDKEEEAFRRYQADGVDGSLSEGRTNAIYSDGQGRVWVGTWDGAMNGRVGPTSRRPTNRLRAKNPVPHSIPAVLSLRRWPYRERFVCTLPSLVHRFGERRFVRLWKHEHIQ